MSARDRAAEAVLAARNAGVNRQRFAQAIAEHLTSAELAERFGISRWLATNLRKAMRA